MVKEEAYRGGLQQPADCRQPRYVVKKTTAATLDFAAVMAQAARIFKGNTDYPCFSDRAARAAAAAFGWAECHPNVIYDQNEMNREFQPAVTTGAYDDKWLGDEWFWAATEMYLLTGVEKFCDFIGRNEPKSFSAPTWGYVCSLGAYDWMTLRPESAEAATYRKQLTVYCDSLVATTAASCFQTPSGNSPKDFGWGCLAETFCTKGLNLLYAYRLTGDKRYLTAATQNADYILGRNPLGQQDKADVKAYPSNQPDESYVDVMQSYASNEIAINWNASLLAFFGWLLATES